MPRAIDGMKECSRCREVKPVVAYGRHAGRTDGLQSWCRPCHREALREAQRRRLATPAGREAHREAMRKYQRRRLSTQEGREAAREVSRRRRSTPEGREAARGYNRTSNSRRYATQEGRAAALERSHRRRTIEDAGIGRTVDFGQLWGNCYGICYLCEHPLVSPRLSHLDHVVPLSRGGAHVLDNLALTHPRCNLTKGAKLLSELTLPFNPPPRSELPNGPTI